LKFRRDAKNGIGVLAHNDEPIAVLLFRDLRHHPVARLARRTIGVLVAVNFPAPMNTFHGISFDCETGRLYSTLKRGNSCPMPFVAKG
jgi:hypothetical protein